MATPPQQVYNDRYEPVRLAARGGMAEVWVAHDAQLDRAVALKVLFPELSVDPNFVERFRREAQAAANLSHPNIVSIFDWGEAGTTYFIVMEYVDGRPLSELVRVEGRLPPARAGSIAADVAAALGFAHRNGVVHRDVKPGNVLIDGDDHVKVTDFGIAMAVGSQDHLTQTGAVMGTATYFSPEQAQGLPVDQRSDVYSLGVVLYELVTGRPPFVADGPVAVAYKHVHEEPLPPRRVDPNIPPPLEAIILQALEKDVRNRYATAEELRADLNRFRTGRPVLADPRPGAAEVAHPVEAAEFARPVAAAEVAHPVAAAGDAAAGVATALPGVAALEAAPYAPAPPGSGDLTGVNGSGRAAGADAPPPVYEGPPPDEGGGGWDEDAPATGGRSSVWRYVIVLVLLLIALGVVLVLLGRQLGLVDSNSGTDTVAPPPPTNPISMPPDLIGKSFTDAANEVQTLGLRYVRVDVQDTQHPQNTIINTSPAAGRQVAGDTVVTLDVSSGPAPITEPDVVGVDVAGATAQLQAAGFTVATPTMEVSPYVAPGQVASTDPPPGSLGHKGDTVRIVVSAPRSVVPIPDVAGDSQLQAAGVLVRDGFQVVVAGRESSPTVPKDDVIGTQPPAGTKVMQGGVVGFIVSLGPSG